MEAKTGGNWLDDDPEFQDLRQRLYQKTIKPKNKSPKSPTLKREPEKRVIAGKRLEQRRDTTRAIKNVQVSLSLSVPKIRVPSKKYIRVALVLAIITFLVGLGIKVFGTQHKTSNPDKSEVLTDSIQSPEYSVVLPSGKEEETSSGKITYDSNRKVTSYTDLIGSVSVTVSQQPLPENFKNNADEEVRKLAENFSANEIISGSNLMAYLGTSEKGPQTVIFHKNDLLIFIQSASKIEKAEWVVYITSLL